VGGVGLGQVVAVIGGLGRGQQAKPPPAAFAREGEDGLDRCPPATARLMCWEACSAAPSSWSRNAVHDGHGPCARGSSAVCPPAGPGRVSPGARGNIML